MALSFILTITWTSSLIILSCIVNISLIFTEYLYNVFVFWNIIMVICVCNCQNIWCNVFVWWNISRNVFVWWKYPWVFNISQKYIDASLQNCPERQYNAIRNRTKHHYSQFDSTHSFLYSNVDHPTSHLLFRTWHLEPKILSTTQTSLKISYKTTYWQANNTIMMTTWWQRINLQHDNTTMCYTQPDSIIISNTLKKIITESWKQ